MPQVRLLFEKITRQALISVDKVKVKEVKPVEGLLPNLSKSIIDNVYFQTFLALEE